MKNYVKGILLICLTGLFSCKYSNLSNSQVYEPTSIVHESRGDTVIVDSTELADSIPDIEKAHRSDSIDVDKPFVSDLIEVNQLPDSVEFVIDQTIFTPPVTEVSMSIINNTNSFVSTGYRYSVERLICGKWEKCPRKYLTAVDDVGIRIPPGETYSFSMDISNIKGGYQKGTYRIRKSISIGKMAKPIFCVFYVE